MITIHRASLSYGSQMLFDDISFACLPDQRIGVLGRNGAGKSTLLKIIAGYGNFDEGNVALDRHRKLAYMPQEVVLYSTKTVIEEALTVFEAYQALVHEAKKLEEQLAASQDPALLERYSALHERYNQYEVAQAVESTEKILKGLGFNSTQFQQPVAELSVGWKMRLVLAKLLLEDADFYLFDEPTNHLDLPSKEWFFEFLKNGSFGFLLVTHDRHYLEKACDYILALERGKAKFFHGSLTQYLAEEERQRTVLESSYHRQQKEIARKEDTIARFKAKASKAKMAQSMMKQLEKMDRIEMEPTLPMVRFSFPAVKRSGDVVLTLTDIKHSFDEKLLFKNVKGTIQRGERIALVAPNGVGKTTLFNLINGKYPKQHGTIGWGHNVHYTVFEQDQMAALQAHNTVIDEVQNAAPQVLQGEIRMLLGAFLFTGDAINKKIEMLSGGERNRVAMVKVLLQKANFLLLDEPTNHLDLYAKDVLLQALKHYGGTMLFVSHDHSFLQELATHIWELTPDGLIDYPGDYESFLDYRKSQENGQTNVDTNSAKKGDAAPVSSKNRKQVQALESKIETLETRIKNLQESFFSLEYGTVEYDRAAQNLKDLQQKLDELFTQWTNCSNNP